MLRIGLVVALITSCAFAVPPVWRTLRDPGTLMDGGRTVSPGGSSAMDGLVVGQVALALILVMGCGLLVRSAWRIQQIDPGFHAPYGVSARVDLPWTAEEDGAATAAFLEGLLDALRADPLVMSASASIGRPFAIPGRGR